MARDIRAPGEAVSTMATTDPTPRANTKANAATPSIPPQRHHRDGSLTQQRVDAIFRALVVQRAIEQRTQRREQADPEH